jgi:hypothetical protein
MLLVSVAIATLVAFSATSTVGQSPAQDPNSSVSVSEDQQTSAQNAAPPATDSAGAPEQTPAAAPPTTADRYRDGMVIWETPADARVPFLLKFNINTQLRYLNTQSSDETFTDHLGGSHDVHTRNDITVNRAMFILGGYVFDQRARYSFTVWTSAGAASIVVASNIGWQFNKALSYRRLHRSTREPIAGQYVPIFHSN